MVDEVAKGNMPNGVFHTRTWTSMTTRLSSITNCSYNKEQLEVKMHKLRDMYGEFNLYLQNIGFAWNVEANTFIANAQVWQNYLEAHNKAGEFQIIWGDHHKLLEIIFNKHNAIEVRHHSSTQDPPNTAEENELDNQYLKTVSASHVHDDSDSSNDDIQEV